MKLVKPQRKRAKLLNLKFKNKVLKNKGQILQLWWLEDFCRELWIIPISNLILRMRLFYSRPKRPLLKIKQNHNNSCRLGYGAFLFSGHTEFFKLCMTFDVRILFTKETMSWNQNILILYYLIFFRKKDPYIKSRNLKVSLCPPKGKLHNLNDINYYDFALFLEKILEK